MSFTRRLPEPEGRQTPELFGYEDEDAIPSAQPNQDRERADDDETGMINIIFFGIKMYSVRTSMWRLLLTFPAVGTYGRWKVVKKKGA
jgi:hypothetical protein